MLAEVFLAPFSSPLVSPSPWRLQEQDNGEVVFKRYEFQLWSVKEWTRPYILSYAMWNWTPYLWALAMSSLPSCDSRKNSRGLTEKKSKTRFVFHPDFHAYFLNCSESKVILAASVSSMFLNLALQNPAHNAVYFIPVCTKLDKVDSLTPVPDQLRECRKASDWITFPPTDPVSSLPSVLALGKVPRFWPRICKKVGVLIFNIYLSKIKHKINVLNIFTHAHDVKTIIKSDEVKQTKSWCQIFLWKT